MTVFTKRRLATAAAFVAGVALATPTAWSVENLGVFELEGDATQESGGVNPGPPFGPDDWTNILIMNGKSTVDPAIATLKATTQGVGITLTPGYPGVLQDPAPNTIFTTGGGKDILDITMWMWKNGSVPPKDDITDAYAAAYVLNEDINQLNGFSINTDNKKGDLIIYFGEDRATTNGAADLGFWFLQSGITNVAGGTFSGAHVKGDILVLVDFTIGGTVATIQILEWVGTGGEISGTLHAVTGPISATCVPGTLTNDRACAITNPVTTTLPWTNPETGSTAFPPQSFYEGGINLSRIYRDLGLTLPCVSTFVAESRSSPSPTATLKDFVLGTFTLCGFDVTKECTAGKLNTANTGFDWTFDATVTNTGAAPIFVTVTDTPNQGTIYQGATTTIVSNQLVATTFNTGSQTYGTIGMAPNPSSDTVTVTASATSGGPTILTKTAMATCPPVSTTPKITVDKLCTGADPTCPMGQTCQPLGTFLDVVNGQIVVKVKVDAHVCNPPLNINPGAVNLINLNVTDDDGQGASTPMAVNDTLNVGQCKDYTEIYTPNGAGLMPPVTTTSTVSFTDTVTATATAVLGFGTVGPKSASPAAPCPLCK